MTTLAVQGIQAFARGGVQALTQLAVSTATGALTRALDNRVFEGPRLESFHLQTSRDGAPMSRIFGRVRLAGQVIWASQVRETVTEESVGGKGGGPVRRDYSYTISFAVGLCEGEILGVDRIWVNGEILQRGGVTVRVHKGSDAQGPDPVIAATEGADVPAFRGTAYLVFEDFPLDDYGARLPIINAEVVRGPASASGSAVAGAAADRSGRMEKLIQSVNLLPGTGEFALSPTVVEETPAPGRVTASNMNSFTGQADLLTSLDQLETELPAVRHVSVISAWFGTSLDAGSCAVQPGAERRDRRLRDAKWRVAGVERGQAYIVSDMDGRPNYGGTPSDDSLIACIGELKRRGFAVTLYPFLLMDVPGFPWRGRIAAGSTADVDAFFGTDEDFRFRHSILHHARLAQAAGGVDAIVIGTELKALCAFRDGDAFPAVTHLRSLAGAVRAIVGTTTKITYAADWSDYFGVHTFDNQGGSDVRYHLDPLWADSNIDAVGIDAYFPLADWREGDHLDARPGRRNHDLDYLQANVEGGEGYDWYYASRAERDAQIRSPIDDPVYRYKDMRHWWSQPHVERHGGRPAGQSPWVPRSKPIWLLEIGCPAVDKGANQPNVFSDEKSVDAALPYHSDGARDDLIQRRYLEALLSHYGATNEPGFLDLSRASVWAWDARPFPDFPARTAMWSDGDNWARGHWLNGRTGLMPVADVIEAVVRQTGVSEPDLSGVSGVVTGYRIDRPMSARAALGPLMQLFDVELSERAGALTFSIGGPDGLTLTSNDLVKGPFRRTRQDPETRIRDVRLTYLDAARSYQLGSASARQMDAESVAVADIAVPAVLDEGFARHVARRELDAAHAGRETLGLSLPLQTGLRLDIGDRVRFDDAVWAVETLEVGMQVDVTARRDTERNRPWLAGATPVDPPPIDYVAAPDLIALDLPGRSGVSVGAVAHPFQPVTVRGPDAKAVLDAPLHIGATLSEFARGPVHVWDRTTQIDVAFHALSLSARTEAATLSGGNRFAVETPTGWEVIAARDARLTAPGTYRLSHLLRGLDGSEPFMADMVPAGARIIWLGSGLETLSVSDDWRGTVVAVTGETSQRSARPGEVLWQDLDGLPPSPAQLRWNGAQLSWIGRDPTFTDWTENADHLRYRVRLFRGAAVETIETASTSLQPDPFDRVEIVQVGPTGRTSLSSSALNVTP